MINRKYREKGYQVVFALYLDKGLYGIQKKNEDRIIYTDISFDEASAYDTKGNEKKRKERLFNKNYSSPVYGFTIQLNKRK